MAGDDRSPFNEILEQEPFCQGDILHRDSSENGGLGSFGVIITADCDIAQKKDGGEFSILRVITAEQYIREIWARIELEKLIQRQISAAMDALNAAIISMESGLQPLTAETLKRWLNEQTPEDIIEAIGITGKAVNRDLLKALHCVKDATPTHNSEPPMEALKRVWRRLETTQKNIRSRLTDILDSSRGAADAYFLPYLPGFKEIGFVIQLRSFSSIPRSSVYPSRIDARLSGQPDLYFRVGRFRDGIKYSIVHRMVNLFSRVGLSEEYEAESSSAVDMVVDTIHSHIVEGA